MMAARKDLAPFRRAQVEDDRRVHARIRAEYEEMPGLRLTLSQAARLFNLDLERCARVLEGLVSDGTIWTNGREFLSRSIGRHRV